MTVALLTGLVLGFLGSVHCIGMCGPLALALPAAGGNSFRFFGSRLLYNFGRVVTYIGLGGIVGGIGGAIPLPDVQRWISIGSGVSLLVFSAASLAGGNFRARLPALNRLQALVTSAIGHLMGNKTLAGLFALGLLNGLLPCGFVYVALAGAIALAKASLSMAFMAGFGLGTIPAMFGVSLTARIFGPALRQRLVRLLPAFTILVGILLIVRGLNLGIPYISPRLHPVSTHTEPACCH